MEVDFKELAGLPKMFDRMGTDTSNAQQYMKDGIDAELGAYGGGEGLINVIAGGHRNAYDTACEFLEKLKNDGFSEHAEAIRETIEQYKSTDEFTAKDLDDQVDVAKDDKEAASELQGTLYRQDLPDELFDDLVSPKGNLGEVPDYDEKFPPTPSWGDVASPSAWVKDAIWGITKLGTEMGLCDRPYDIISEIVEPLTGDWATGRLYAQRPITTEMYRLACWQSRKTSRGQAKALKDAGKPTLLMHVKCA